MKFRHLLAARGRWGYWPAMAAGELQPTAGATMRQMRSFGQAMDAEDARFWPHPPVPADSPAGVRLAILGKV